MNTKETLMNKIQNDKIRLENLKRKKENLNREILNLERKLDNRIFQLNHLKNDLGE